MPRARKHKYMVTGQGGTYYKFEIGKYNLTFFTFGSDQKVQIDTGGKDDELEAVIMKSTDARRFGRYLMRTARKKF